MKEVMRVDIAVVGAGAEVVCRAAGVGAQAFSVLSYVSGLWDLLALMPQIRHPAPQPSLYAKTLLLPGNGDPQLAHRLRALQLIGYGLSPRDSLTLSSLAPGRLLCLQRSLLTPDGTLLEPQELPLPQELSALDDECALLAAGLRLLSGRL